MSKPIKASQLLAKTDSYGRISVLRRGVVRVSDDRTADEYGFFGADEIICPIDCDEHQQEIGRIDHEYRARERLATRRLRP